MELAAGYHPTSSQPTNGWISSPRTSFLSTPRTQTPTGRILSSKTCVRTLMQMAGSVCSCSAQNCHFLHLHLYLTNVLKKHFYFLFPGIHEVHLDPHRNIQSTILCPATTLCFISRMFCDYVTSCVEARHNHDRSNFGANVGQIKQSLSTCGDNYTYRAEVVLGKEPLVLEEMVHFGEKFHFTFDRVTNFLHF